MHSAEGLEKALEGLQQFKDVESEVQNTLIVYNRGQGAFKFIEPSKARILLKLWQSGQLNSVD